MNRQILHIDVNNAFLSWTAVDRLKNGESLDIRTIPAIIGGDQSKRRGIVLAKSMPAKKIGIVTGEAIYMAKKKCPNLQIYSSNYNLYKQYSDEMHKIFLEYTDQIERFSIDECFLDMTHFLRPKETLLQKAEEIRKRINDELGFTVNIGVSNNKLLAKMASDFEKPNKIHTLYPEEIKEKMWVLPVSELFMLGRKTVPKLNKLGIKTIGDLAKQNEEMLVKLFGKHGKLMWEYSNGIDDSPVIYKKEMPKGVGNSITLPYDISKIDKLKEILLALTEQVTYRLRKYNLVASNVSVQIRTKDFKNFSHQRKLDIPTDSTKEIYELASVLLEELHQMRIVRLIGVRVDNLSQKDAGQISMFSIVSNEKQNKIDNTIDKLKDKYGYSCVTRAGEMNVNEMLNIRTEK